MFCAAVVEPISSVPKLSEVGFSTTAAPATPVPERDAVTCPPSTLAKTVSVPCRAPHAVGVNDSLMLQLWVGATCVHELNCEKSPVTVELVTVSAALPLFVIAIV